MAQNDLVIANQSFPSFRTDLNNALSAIQTTHSGTSRPTGAVAGQIWLDTTSATSPTLKYYDGADDISLATLDHSANTVNWLDSTVSITGLTTTATGTVLTLSDSSLTSSVNLILQNQKEIRFSETTANGTNYVGFKAPARLSADKIWILPSADGTAGQFLKTYGDGNLSFDSLSFSTPLAVIGNATAGSEIRLPEDTDNGSNYVAIKAPDTLASNLTLTLPSTDGTSGQVLQTNGSGVLSFSSPSADFVLLQSTTASNVASVTIGTSALLTSTYRTYMIIGTNIIPATDSTQSRMRVTIGGTPETGANYQFTRIRMYDGSATVSGFVGVNQTSFNEVWGESIGNASGEHTNFVCYLYDPSATNNYKFMQLHSSMVDSSPNFSQHISSGAYKSTSAIDGVQFFFSSGNITSGYFKLYGLK